MGQGKENSHVVTYSSWSGEKERVYREALCRIRGDEAISVTELLGRNHQKKRYAFSSHRLGRVEHIERGTPSGGRTKPTAYYTPTITVRSRGKGKLKPA